MILLYNNEGSNNCYNFVANETGAGGQFFIPVGTSTLMESTSDSPTVQGTPDCDYCGASYTTPGTWGPIGLGNTADGLQVRCPGCSDDEPAMFQAISYGTGFGTVAMGTNDLGGMFSSGTGTQQTYSYTFSTCITSGTPGTWTRTTAAGAGTPPATAGVVDAGVRTQLESCSIPCCGGFEEQPDEEAVAANGRYRYGFNGQEKDNEVYGSEGTSYTAEFCQYDPRVARRWNLDPVDKPWQSRYHAFSNRPTTNIDPNGANDSPIYDQTGELLGTDDNGLTGEAIVMDKSLFKQGMSHEEALTKETTVDNACGLSCIGNEAKQKIDAHFEGLPSRPDYDGRLTLEEANEWYRTGNGQSLFVDLAKIDLSRIYSTGDGAVGQVKVFNLLLASKSLNDGLVYGQVTLKRYPADQVRAFADEYNFEMHNGWNPLNWPRNAEAKIGERVAGSGTGYDINIYGTQTLEPVPKMRRPSYLP